MGSSVRWGAHFVAREFWKASATEVTQTATTTPKSNAKPATVNANLKEP
jgi:hypothetical protein